MRNKIEAAADSPSLDSSAYHCTRREENHEKEAIAGDSTEEAHLKAAVHKVYADVVEESQQEAPQIAYRLKRSRLKKTFLFFKFQGYFTGCDSHLSSESISACLT